MALTHKVQTGDTISAIAKRFNVPKTAISGFKSNNPNVIFPGEVLTITEGTPQTSQNPQQQANIPQAGQIDPSGTALQATRSPVAPVSSPAGSITPDGTALQPSGGVPLAQPVAQAPVQPQQTQQPQPASVTTTQIGPQNEMERVMQQLADINPELADQAMTALGFTGPTQQPTTQTQAPETRQVQTPSGMTIDIDAQGNIIDTETGEIITDPREQEATQLFGGFGISTDDIASGLRTNPFGTLSAIMQTIMQQSGIPDLRANITSITSEIESLENERDAEIAKVQDNPFFSGGSKSERIQKIQDRFEQRIANRVNRLTLLQGAQQEARQQAQFVTNSAIQLFGLQLSDQQKQEALDVERNERMLEAAAQAGALNVENVGGFKVLRDSSGKIISTKAPENGGGVSGQISPGVFINEFGETVSASNPPKAPNTSERTSFTFFQRMKDAVDTLEGFPQVVFDTNKLNQALLNQNYAILQNPEQQIVAQAMRQFTEARLRKDSGAAIPPEEFVNDRRTYFPQFGESTEVLERKGEARENALAGVRSSSGNAYWEFYGENPRNVGQRLLRGEGPQTTLGPVSDEIKNELDGITFKAPAGIGDFFSKLFGG